MKKELFYINKGFSLVEILVSVSVFLIFSLSFSTFLINSFTQIKNVYNKEKATALAEEGLEAVRSIKEADFSNLVDGDYGLVVSNNHFNISETNDITDIFTRKINISTLEDSLKIKKVESEVSWQEDKSIVLTTYFTNWSEIIEEEPVVETCQDYCISVGYEGGVCRQNPRRCRNNKETYEINGDIFCPGPPMRNCCCQ